MWAAKWVDMKAVMLCARGRVTFECNNKLASLSVYISLCFPLWVCVWNRAQRVCRVEMRELSAGGGKKGRRKKEKPRSCTRPSLQCQSWSEDRKEIENVCAYGECEREEEL